MWNKFNVQTAFCVTSLEKKLIVSFISHGQHPASQISPEHKANNLNYVNTHGI